MKKVLLVEDHPMFSNAIEHLLSQKRFEMELVKRLPATVEDQEFQNLLKRADEFCCVIWDGNMNNKNTTDGFIQAFAKVFKGPMLTFSASSSLCEKQMEAGCTHDTGKNLDTVIDCLVSLREEGKL